MKRYISAICVCMSVMLIVAVFNIVPVKADDKIIITYLNYYSDRDNVWDRVFLFASNDNESMEWPGEEMHSIGNNLFQVEIDKKYTKIEFNNDSSKKNICDKTEEVNVSNEVFVPTEQDLSEDGLSMVWKLITDSINSFQKTTSAEPLYTKDTVAEPTESSVENSDPTATSMISQPNTDVTESTSENNSSLPTAQPTSANVEESSATIETTVPTPTKQVPTESYKIKGEKSYKIIKGKKLDLSKKLSLKSSTTNKKLKKLDFVYKVYKNKKVVKVSKKGIITSKKYGKSTLVVTSKKAINSPFKITIRVVPKQPSFIITKSYYLNNKTYSRIQIKSPKKLRYKAEFSYKENGKDYTLLKSKISKKGQNYIDFGATKGYKIYTRVRAYVKVSGEKYYGPWSPRISFKT